MLVTTCPDCRTTFRISPEILGKADGRVRCGRCAAVFDGQGNLRELADPEPEASTATEVESKIEALEPRAPEPSWMAEQKTRPRARLYAIGASVLLLALIGQLIHQFRSELARLPTIGPVVQFLYTRIGMEARAAVDLEQYDLIDLTAAAQPVGEEPGWLVIETRVHNEGPRAQPYPFIFVRLLDRWEETIAGRYFAPEEYSIAALGDDERMNAGATIDAQFIIADPGASATGFELEICVPAEQRFLCESDLIDH